MNGVCSVDPGGYVCPAILEGNHSLNDPTECVTVRAAMRRDGVHQEESLQR